MANTYYFSSVSGNDSRSSTEAQNPATPWKSIEKLNSYFSSLKAGDEVSFKRNEVFSGSIILKASGISFTAYGTGSNPTISALNTITQWQPVGNGIYESLSTLERANVNVLLINNAIQELGRYPNSSAANKGYLKIESKTDNSITDSKLGSSINWKGAEVVIRKMHWILDRHQVTAHNGNTLVFDRSNSSYTPSDNYGYFIQNDLRTLDSFGEWYFNPSNKKIYVYFGTSAPSSYKVEVSTLDNIVALNAANGAQSNIIFENINFKGANVNAFSLASGSNISLKTCNIEFSGNTAISATDIKNLTVENCIISISQNNGIALTDRCTGAIIKGNSINKTMPFSGMGKSGDHNGIAIYATANNTLIDHNRITNTGYVGVYFGGENSHVKNNFVDNYCSIKDDGGGIYTFTGVVNTNFTNRSIVNNIITNGIGVKEGTSSETGSAVGIYLDDNVTGVNVSNNSVSTVADNGIFIHNARNNAITKNTVYNCGAAFSTSHDDLGNPITNLQVSENIFFAKYPTQWAGKLTSKKDDISNIGSLNKNYYLRPFDDDKVIHTQRFIHSPSYISTDYNLSGWTAKFKYDANSKKSPITFPAHIFNKTIGSNRLANGAFTSNVAGPMFYGDGSTSSAWDNGNKLGAGGSMKLTSSALSYFIINVGAVDASKSYVLRFKATGNKDAAIKTFLRQWNAPFGTISIISIVKLTGKTTSYECIFSFPKTEANTCITIQSDNGNFVYWLDDIEFLEADVTNTKPDDYIRFEYNASDAAKSVSLDGTYVDAKNVSYSGSVNVAPYSSIILMRTSATITPSAPGVSGNDESNTLVSTHDQFPKDILVSENGGEFKAYTDTIKVGNVARDAGYWKFKIKAAANRNESAETPSPAFNATANTPTAPKISADDAANTLMATHNLYASHIVFSENNGDYQNYTGTINVGNVSRASGYWKFKISSGNDRMESSVVNSPAFNALTTPGVPILVADDVANTLSANHDTYAGDIVVSENDGAFQPYSGTINVGNDARAVGYWKFKIRPSTNRSESAVVPSPAFSATGSATPPVLTADDTANTLSASHNQYFSEIIFSENNGSYQSYTGTINVGNVSRAAGYWKFKISSGTNRMESSVVNSPAFNALTAPSVPILVADDVANTLSANHDTYAGDIVVSENDGAFQIYTGTISVGNVARPSGYWKFKIRPSTNRSESAVVPSPAFSATGSATPPVLTADDTANTLSASHNQYFSEIIFSENNGSYQSYTGTINVGNVSRAAGYWKFKISSGTNRMESSVINSPAFNALTTPGVPILAADDVANTLSANHDPYAGDIVVSENDGAFQLYTGTINVGNVSRAAGYWKFKIRSGTNRMESSVVNSPAFNALTATSVPILVADDVANMLSANHDTYAGDIVVSENDGAFQLYTGTINVGNVARPSGYWKFKIRPSTNRSESAVVPSPAFSVTGSATPPVLTADDTANTIKASHNQYSSEIIFSENNGSYQSYTGTIDVGNFSRAEGYWKFKIKAAADRAESSVINSPAFYSAEIISPPNLFADDVANTLTASHTLYPAAILVSENNGDFQPYTGYISVGNVSRPAGYWKFKISATANRIESALVSSRAFTIPDKPSAPMMTADDMNNTLSVNHDLYSKDILVSENGGNFTAYAGTINVGDFYRATGYWKFKIKATVNRLESDLVSSPVFTQSSETAPPRITTDKIAKTLIAYHDEFQDKIVYSENSGVFKSYQMPISVGDVDREAGYWRFKIISGPNRRESVIVSSPTISKSILDNPIELSLYPNPVQSILSVKYPEVSNTAFIEVISINGQKAKKIMLEKGSVRNEIDVSNLPVGTFLLYFNDGVNKLTKKFIKVD